MCERFTGTVSSTERHLERIPVSPIDSKSMDSKFLIGTSDSQMRKLISNLVLPLYLTGLRRKRSCLEIIFT